MSRLSSEMLHASSVAIGGRAVLIEGLPGSGKSDLALRLIDRGATLISDDYTLVQRHDGALVAMPSPNIQGMIEVRGLGIVDMPFADQAPVALIVSLGEPIERLPHDGAHRTIAGVEIPNIALIALEASAPIKVELALRRIAPTS